MKISNNRLYLVALVILIIINGALIFLLVQKGPHHRPGPRGHNPLLTVIGDKLELTDNQRSQYAEMAFQHREQMRKIEREQKRLVTSYFETLVAGSDLTSKDAIAEQISKHEKKKLQITYAHFEELKAMLDDSQKERFGSILKDILRVLVGNEKKLPPPPRER